MKSTLELQVHGEDNVKRDALGVEAVTVYDDRFRGRPATAAARHQTSRRPLRAIRSAGREEDTS